MKDTRSSTYSITLRRDWELPSKFYPKGTYRVPEEMPRHQAETALAKGIATKSLPVFELKRGRK